MHESCSRVDNKRSTYYNKDVYSVVQVGFYGENTVYIQGLSTGYLPDAWVMGTLEGTTLTIPETYLGTDAWGEYLYEGGKKRMGRMGTMGLMDLMGLIGKLNTLKRPVKHV